MGKKEKYDENFLNFWEVFHGRTIYGSQTKYLGVRKQDDLLYCYIYIQSQNSNAT